MTSKTYSFGRFDCHGTELVLCEATFAASTDRSPVIPGAMRSMRIPSREGTWIVSPVYDEANPVYPLEVILRHEDAPSSATEVRRPDLVWTETGRLVVVDVLAAADPMLREAYINHASRPDYVANEHDHVLERGLIISLGSSVAASVFVTECEGLATAIRIHNPWHAILNQRLRNRMMDHFEVASWSVPQRQHEASAYLLDWAPLDNVDAEVEFPSPAYSSEERNAVRAYDRAWKEAAIGMTMPLVPKIIDTPFWARMRPAAETAFAVFRTRGELPEDVELDPGPPTSDANIKP